MSSDNTNSSSDEGWRGPKLRNNARGGYGGQFPYSRNTMGAGYSDRNTLQ